jgi:hypothetical protein
MDSSSHERQSACWDVVWWKSSQAEVLRYQAASVQMFFAHQERGRRKHARKISMLEDRTDANHPSLEDFSPAHLTAPRK